MPIETDTRILPSYWASALIDGDYSGLSDEEERELNDFLDSEPTLMECVDCGEEYFARYNDAGTLAGMVAEFTFFTK